ncbi:hypothetical protein Mapa_000091 [Marchantia paleacea]|nr:hypothetical protein Mapa_000091 [Marchantia paleacea]
MHLHGPGVERDESHSVPVICEDDGFGHERRSSDLRVHGQRGEAELRGDQDVGRDVVLVGVEELDPQSSLHSCSVARGPVERHAGGLRVRVPWEHPDRLRVECGGIVLRHDGILLALGHHPGEGVRAVVPVFSRGRGVGFFRHQIDGHGQSSVPENVPCSIRCDDGGHADLPGSHDVECPHYELFRVRRAWRHRDHAVPHLGSVGINRDLCAFRLVFRTRSPACEVPGVNPLPERFHRIHLGLVRVADCLDDGQHILHVSPDVAFFVSSCHRHSVRLTGLAQGQRIGVHGAHGADFPRINCDVKWGAQDVSTGSSDIDDIGARFVHSVSDQDPISTYQAQRVAIGWADHSGGHEIVTGNIEGGGHV